MFDPEKFGEAMGEAIRSAVEPLLKRIEELESKSLTFAKDGAPGEPGKNGEPGKDGQKGADGLGLAGAMIDRDGSLQITLTNGEVKNLGPVVGKDGSNGSDGLSFDSFDMEYLSDTHEVTIKASSGGRTKSITYPAGGIVGRGYWTEGCKAKKGEAWTSGGCLWIALKDTATDPAIKSDGWFMAARKGRDGENGRAPKPVDNSPIKLVN